MENIFKHKQIYLKCLLDWKNLNDFFLYKTAQRGRIKNFLEVKWKLLKGWIDLIEIWHLSNQGKKFASF